MDAVVQLIRNALCCMKDWGVGSSTPLYDQNFTTYFYELPPPLNETTPLEVLISVCQFYAFWSFTRSGFSLMRTSLGKFNYFLRLMDYRTDVPAAHRLTPPEELVNESLLKEGELALRSTLVGFMVMCIGISFFWLGGNSWHVTETWWLGGVQGLIHALTVMEVCLLPLLYYMWIDGSKQLAKSRTMISLADRVESDSIDKLSVDDLQILTDWKPVWSHGVVMSWADLSTSKDRHHLDRETRVVKEHLEVFIAKNESAAAGKKKKAAGGDDYDDDEKEAKIRHETLQAKAKELRVQARIARWEGYREYLYFVINLVAFCGYLQGILAFYFDDDVAHSHGFSAMLVPRLKLGMSNAVADWRGNFIGDLMWTVEPAIIMTTPALFRRWAGVAGPPRGETPPKAKTE
jgi:hypothetical protein